MDTPAASGEALAALWERLAADPRRHDFFATLRRVEALTHPWPRLGRALRPSQEALRLGQEPDLDFAPAALAGLERREGAVPSLRVLFFGLLGPNGPMPLHLTEYTRERLRQRNDPTLSRFLDVFHHRLLLLFYRAWAQNQPVVQHDRPHDDRFAAWLGACTGLGAGAPPGGSTLPMAAQLFQAGLLSQRSRHPEGLAKLLTQYFGVPVRIEQHVAQWLEIDAEDCRPLGWARNRAERSEATIGRLGESATSGRRRLDRQYRFRIVLGPLGLSTYLDFLPGRPAWRALCAWVRQYVGIDLRWDVQLVLAQQDIPQPRPKARVRLGISTWIGKPRTAVDRDELRLRPDTTFLLHRPDEPPRACA